MMVVTTPSTQEDIMVTWGDPIVTNRLRQLRRSQGVAQYGLAVRAEVSPTVIGAIERHDYVPGAEVRARIAQALGVAVRDIWPDATTSGPEPVPPASTQA
jgi:DNA-binding XRE family transcriptional regulator